MRMDACSRLQGFGERWGNVWTVGKVDRYTFEQFSAVDLTGGEFKGDDMSLDDPSELTTCVCGSDMPGGLGTWASFRSLMGMPIVDVSLPMSEDT